MTTRATIRALVLDAPNAAFRDTEVVRTVLVRIEASGGNPLDLKIRVGAAAHARGPLPGILGIDLAGIAEAVGLGVAGFSLCLVL